MNPVNFTRFLSQSIHGAKIAIIGASGGIGQPLSLLLKMNQYVSSLYLYDRQRPPGVTVDLSHINTPCKVIGLRGEPNLPEALIGSDVVIIPAGSPRKPGMTRDDLFMCNATIAKQLATYCAKYCPNACILLITNPVNCLIPLISEVYRSKGIDVSKRLFGVTKLDSIRASTFVSHELNLPPDSCPISVIGGHAGKTIIPLLSQLPNHLVDKIDVVSLTKRIQFAGDEVVIAKEGNGSATLSMAYAAASFTTSILRAMNGEKNIVEHAFIQQDYQNCHFFSSEIKLNTHGVEEPIPLPKTLSQFEMDLLDEALPILEKQALQGISFVGR